MDIDKVREEKLKEEIGEAIHRRDPVEALRIIEKGKTDFAGNREVMGHLSVAEAMVRTTLVSPEEREGILLKGLSHLPENSQLRALLILATQEELMSEETIRSLIPEPKEGMDFFALGSFYFQKAQRGGEREDYSTAAHWYEQALGAGILGEGESDNLSVVCDLLFCYEALGRRDKIAALYEKKPSLFSIYASKALGGFAFLGRKKFGTAFKLLREAVEEGEKEGGVHTDIYAGLVVCAEALGDKEGYRRFLREAGVKISRGGDLGILEKYREEFLEKYREEFGGDPPRP